jgi:DNA processing protein
MTRQSRWDQRFGPLDERRARQIILIGVLDPATMGRLVDLHKGALVALSTESFSWDEDDVARRVERELAELPRLGVSLLMPGDEGWPGRLDGACSPPKLLYVRGRLPDWRESPGLGIVGSRRQAAYGERVAARFGAAWTRMGGSVVSGGALGVDTAAHLSAVDSGGVTVAVLANGVDRPYPAGNRKLFARIVAQGALVSELPLGTGPIPRNFPWRNRIIAGLSHAVVVAQAAAKSGALHTASFALKYGRKLFTVPASVEEEACLGSLNLLVQGASALVRPEQLAELYSQVADTSVSAATAAAVADSLRPVVRLSGLPGLQRQVLEVLSSGILHIDELAADLNMKQAALSLALLDLELKDLIVKQAGNRYACNARIER